MPPRAAVGGGGARTVWHTQGKPRSALGLPWLCPQGHVTSCPWYYEARGFGEGAGASESHRQLREGLPHAHLPMPESDHCRGPALPLPQGLVPTPLALPQATGG